VQQYRFQSNSTSLRAQQLKIAVKIEYHERPLVFIYGFTIAWLASEEKDTVLHNILADPSYRFGGTTDVKSGLRYNCRGLVVYSTM